MYFIWIFLKIFKQLIFKLKCCITSNQNNGKRYDSYLCHHKENAGSAHFSSIYEDKTIVSCKDAATISTVE